MAKFNRRDLGSGTLSEPNFLKRQLRHGTRINDTKKKSEREKMPVTSELACHFRLPIEYADVLFEIYPNMSFAKAVKRFVMETIDKEKEWKT